jgi:transcriptional regulator GlxA family with amidase domain
MPKIVLAVCLAAASAGAQAQPLNVAFLVFPGVQVIDYAAPFEVFGQAASATKQYNVFTVAETLDSLATSGGPGAARILPRYSFADHPKIDILVVPGGGGLKPSGTGVGLQLTNPVLIDFIRTTGKDARYVLSVCNGAFLIGKAGLLDGLDATTFWGMLDKLPTMVPGAHLVTDQRFVDNGKVITTAGLSSGIDGALHVIERVSGAGRAQQVALQMEYDWRPQAGFARSGLPDMVLWYGGINPLLLQQLHGVPRVMAGDKTSFEEVIAIAGTAPRDLFREIASTVAQDTAWQAQTVDTSTAKAPSGMWHAKDFRGNTVAVDVRLEPVEHSDSTLVRIGLRAMQLSTR